MSIRWKKQPTSFLASFLPPVLWLAIFFIVPMAIIWLYSFGESTSLTEISLTGTFANYAKVFDSLYIGILVKSVFGPYPLLYNNFAVLVGLVYVHLPFAVLPLYSALDRIDRSSLEASLDLGAGHLRTVFYIAIPACWAGIFSAAFITFIPALGSFLTPELLGGPSGQMIASVIERQFKRANDWPFGAALSFLLVYLTIAIVLCRNYFERKKAQGGEA